MATLLKRDEPSGAPSSVRATTRKLAVLLGQLGALAVFGLALWVLRRELSHVSFQHLLEALRSIPPGRTGLALALTLGGYAVMTGYDHLGLRYVGRRLRWWRISVVSFLSYAVSNNVGLSAFSGAALRHRYYTALGLSTPEILRLLMFTASGFWCGLLVLAGASLVCAPTGRLLNWSIAPGWEPWVGGIMMAAPIAYVGACRRMRRSWRVRGIELRLPHARLALGQILVSCLDWLLAGSVMFVLLPPDSGLSLIRFLPIFFIAIVVALVSHVPGGLGVFETLMLLQMGWVDRAALFGTLIMFRAIYYLVPFGVALMVVTAYEGYEHRRLLRRVSEKVTQAVSTLTPHVLAIAVFMAGMVLLVSGAMPAEMTRMAWLQRFLPLPLVEMSHFLASVVGAVLLLLARGVQRRMDAAYFLSMVLLGTGAVFSVMKGLDYEEAAWLGLVMLALRMSRRHFQRRSNLLAVPFTVEWFSAILLAAGASLWLGLFLHKHIEYSDALWWQFEWSGDASRFLRAEVGMAVLLMLYGVARLLRPKRPGTAVSGLDNLDRLVPIVQAYPRAYAHLALMGDKELLFSADGGGFIMYGSARRSLIAMGDPVGTSAQKAELAWSFRELCHRQAAHTVFYQVCPEELPIYLDLGLTITKIGEEARVALGQFTLEGGARKAFRYVLRKLEKENVRFGVLTPRELAPVLPQMRRVSDAWLLQKNVREKAFSLGYFDETYLGRCAVAAAWKGDELVAFSNLWQGAHAEFSVDLMRYHPEQAPPSVMEFLFLQLMLWGKEQGFDYFNMGMAPLAGMGDRALAPLWSKLGARIFRHGEHFYNFQGLRQYKEKFDPDWEPRYLVCPGGLSLPGVLTDLAALVSGGFSGMLRK